MSADEHSEYSLKMRSMFVLTPAANHFFDQRLLYSRRSRNVNATKAIDISDSDEDVFVAKRKDASYVTYARVQQRPPHTAVLSGKARPRLCPRR